MMVKKRGFNDTIQEEGNVVISAVETETEETTKVAEENSGYEDLLATAQEIRKNDQVLGYILKSESKATVDLNEPAKIVEHAMLSSQAFESSKVVAESFELGEVGCAVVEGKTAKVLCLSLDENQVTVFLKKTADAEALRTQFVQTR